jgi:hypothetical protein
MANSPAPASQVSERGIYPLARSTPEPLHMQLEHHRAARQVRSHLSDRHTLIIPGRVFCLHLYGHEILPSFLLSVIFSSFSTLFLDYTFKQTSSFKIFFQKYYNLRF